MPKPKHETRKAEAALSLWKVSTAGKEVRSYCQLWLWTQIHKTNGKVKVGPGKLTHTWWRRTQLLFEFLLFSSTKTDNKRHMISDSVHVITFALDVRRANVNTGIHFILTGFPTLRMCSQPWPIQARIAAGLLRWCQNDQKFMNFECLIAFALVY